MRAATLIVSPKRVYLGRLRPTTPAEHGPECSPTRSRTAPRPGSAGSTGVAAADAQAKLQVEVDQLQRDIQVAEGKLAEMQNASVSRWKDFQAALSEAVDRLHSGPDSAVPG